MEPKKKTTHKIIFFDEQKKLSSSSFSSFSDSESESSDSSVGTFSKKAVSSVRTRTERKKICLSLFEKFKAQYPQYFYSNPDFKIPCPKKAPSLDLVLLSEKQMAQIQIPDLQKSVLCGTCVTDSSIGISKGYANARVQNRHSIIQASWFFWKWTVCLKKFSNGINSISLQDPDGFQVKTAEKPGEYRGKLKIASQALPVLTKLYTVISNNNRKCIKRSWLNHMTDYFLMTVWLDDGSLMNNRQGQICLDSTPRDEQAVFIAYLKAVWDIECYLYDTKEKMGTGETRFRICIKDQENLLKLLRIVAPIIPVKEMLYKIMFVPLNNTDLLQRWASEVVDLVLPEFREYVRLEYQEYLSSYPNKVNGN